jgi:hypothetical protein
MIIINPLYSNGHFGIINQAKKSVPVRLHGETSNFQLSVRPFTTNNCRNNLTVFRISGRRSALTSVFRF